MIDASLRLTGFIALLLMTLDPSTASAKHVGIITLDGTRYEDSFALTKAGVEIVAPGRTLATIPPSRILHADLGDPIIPGESLVVLTSGETLAMKETPRLDAGGLNCTVRATSAGLVLPLDQVARVLCTDQEGRFISRIPTGQSGVLLRGGDFFQGDIEQLNAWQVRVTSVLFGTQNFDCHKQVIAIAFHDAVRPDARWVARMLDGTVLLLNRLDCDSNEWLVNDAVLGAIHVNVSFFSTLDAGGDLVQSLADRKPDAADVGSFAVNRTAAGVPMTLVGYVARNGIDQRAGSSLSWKLDGSEQSFIAHVGVASTQLPVATVRFSVLADGKELFRSNPLNSVDDSTTVVASLIGFKVLTLRVENDAGKAIFGFWADPLCVRR